LYGKCPAENIFPGLKYPEGNILRTEERCNSPLPPQLEDCYNMATPPSGEIYILVYMKDIK
jgi:hypothetical protein